MQVSSIIRSDDLRVENRRRILHTLRSEGPCTPAQLSKRTALSAASISTLTTQMIHQGILLSERYSTAPEKSQRGRPQTQLSLNPPSAHVLTLTLTIDQICTTLVDYAGTTIDHRRRELSTCQLDAALLLEALTQCIDELMTSHGDIDLQHIGVGFQGQTGHANGTLIWSPIIRARQVPLGSILHKRFAVDVNVDNDCHLISRALSTRHGKQLGNTFATVLFSHGVGLGLYLNGKPFTGTRSSALELGHLRFQRQGALCRCGRRGCIEAYAADYGIERLAQQQEVSESHSTDQVKNNTERPPSSKVSDKTMDKLTRNAHSGDPVALQAYQQAGSAVGEGLGHLFALLDPMPVALVGRSESAFQLMRPSILERLEEQLDDSIDPSSLIHCFDNDDTLLQQGLQETSLHHVDHLVAEQNNSLSLAGNQ